MNNLEFISFAHAEDEYVNRSVEDWTHDNWMYTMKIPFIYIALLEAVVKMQSSDIKPHCFRNAVSASKAI